MTSTAAAADIEVTEGDQWSIAITGLGDISTATNIIYVLKHNRWDPDSQSVIKLDQTTGMLIVQGTPWATGADATVVVDDPVAGDITITVKSAASSRVRAHTYADGLKILRSSANGGDCTFRPKGRTVVAGSPVDSSTP